MAVKHIKKYFDQICDQYHDMLNEIRDFEEEAKKGLMEPERLEKIKESIRPLMDNYERWSYMMFLLNQPTRKQKQKAYELRNKKLLDSIKSKNKIDAILDENKDVIVKVSDIKEAKD